MDADAPPRKTSPGAAPPWQTPKLCPAAAAQRTRRCPMPGRRPLRPGPWQSRKVNYRTMLNPAGSAKYLLMLFRVCGRVPRRRIASYGRQVACRAAAMNSCFAVRAGDCLCLAGRPCSPSADSPSPLGFPSPAGRTPLLLVSPSWVRAAHGPPRIKCEPTRSRRHGLGWSLPVSCPGRYGGFN